MKKKERAKKLNSDINSKNYYGYALNEHNLKNIKYLKKLRKQRNKRGFDDSEIFNFDKTFSNWLLPRLIIFRKKTLSYPIDLTFKQWTNIIDKIIIGFEIEDKTYTLERTKKEQKKVKKAYKLFRKWKQDFFW